MLGPTCSKVHNPSVNKKEKTLDRQTFTVNGKKRLPTSIRMTTDSQEMYVLLIEKHYI